MAAFSRRAASSAGCATSPPTTCSSCTPPRADAPRTSRRPPTRALAPLLDEARDDAVGPLGRALTIARQALTGRRVTIDGRSLGTFVAGTQVLTLELIHALQRTGEVRVRVAGAAGPATAARASTASSSSPPTRRPSEVGRDEVVHRPFQVERARRPSPT